MDKVLIKVGFFVMVIKNLSFLLRDLYCFDFKIVLIIGLIVC